MAIQVNGTQVIGNSRELTNIASVDATTAASITAAGVGGASTTYGDVGTYFYGLSSDQASGATLAAGMTTAGSTLGYYNYGGYIYPSYSFTYNNRKTSAGLSGTWRMMNGPLAGGAGGPYVDSSLHVRIS
tara:strand:+ start:106 stop:495 length:390 start_codon:yes stop_codon:yes gene_type:complete